MEESLRRYVRSRAGDRCEYCRLRQEHEALTPFHIEHVIATQHGGTDEDGNLALACAWCNRAAAQAPETRPHFPRAVAPFLPGHRVILRGLYGA